MSHRGADRRIAEGGGRDGNVVRTSEPVAVGAVGSPLPPPASQASGSLDRSKQTQSESLKLPSASATHETAPVGGDVLPSPPSASGSLIPCRTRPLVIIGCPGSPPFPLPLRFAEAQARTGELCMRPGTTYIFPQQQGRSAEAPMPLGPKRKLFMDNDDDFASDFASDFAAAAVAAAVRQAAAEARAEADRWKGEAAAAAQQSLTAGRDAAAAQAEAPGAREAEAAAMVRAQEAEIALQVTRYGARVAAAAAAESSAAAESRVAFLEARPEALASASVPELEFLVTHLLAAHGRATKALAQTEERLCPLCLDRPVDTAIAPCGHTSCGVCAGLCVECATCRGAIESRLRLYGL